MFCAQPAQLYLARLNAHLLHPTAPTVGSFQRRVHLGYIKLLSCPVQKTRLKREQLEYSFFSSHRLSPRVDVVPCREIQGEWACLPLRGPQVTASQVRRAQPEAWAGLEGTPVYRLCVGPLLGGFGRKETRIWGRLLLEARGVGFPGWSPCLEIVPFRQHRNVLLF